MLLRVSYPLACKVLRSSLSTHLPLSHSTTLTVSRQYPSHSHATMSTSCDLTTWAQKHISAIFEARSDDDLHHSFDAAFSSSSEIFVNHEQLSREWMREDMIKRRGAAISASVKWENVMVVPNDQDKPYEVLYWCVQCVQQILMKCGQAGIVAGFLIVTRALKFRIRVSPAQLQTIITINAKYFVYSLWQMKALIRSNRIEQDAAAVADEHGDRRRIVHLFMTMTDKRPPIHFPHPRSTNPEDAEQTWTINI